MAGHRAARHKSMLVSFNEGSKWLQEYSNFNIMELRENLLLEVTKTASFVTKNTLEKIQMNLTPANSVSYSIISDDSTTSDMNKKIAQFANEMSTIRSFDFDPLALKNIL